MIRINILALQKGIVFILCLHCQFNAIASPDEACGTPSELTQNITEANDEGRVKTTITICALTPQINAQGDEVYAGVEDIDFIISSARNSQDSCEGDPAEISGENSFECSDTTSKTGDAVCEMACPDNYKINKKYKLTLCSNNIKEEYLTHNGNMKKISGTRDLSFSVSHCVVQESDDIWKSKNKWNTLYFVLEKKDPPKLIRSRFQVF